MKERIFNLGPAERERVSEHLADFLKDRSEVVFAYLYGSFAEGLPYHDIDVGIYVSQIREENFISYSLALAQAMSANIQMPVDIRILNAAPVTFVFHVISGKLILERNEEIRSRIAERTIQKYLDLKPIIRSGIKEAFGK